MFQKILAYLSPENFKTDTLSGLTVAIALVPEAIAFAIVAGVNPLVGLYAACMVSFIAALLSGRPGMISGATGALAVVMVSLVAEYGVEYLFATVVLMGIIQLVVGICKWGQFARIIPHPVMMGFVNGLAIVIGLSQLSQFKTVDGEWLGTTQLLVMAGFVLLTMAIMYGLPKITKAIPSALVAIVVVAVLVLLFQIDTPTVRDMLISQENPLGSMQAGFPGFHIPSLPLTFAALWVIIPYAFILAFIGLVESLMTLSLIDEITDTKGQSNKECLAQGTANVVTGFFGGMGGCAMVGQSMINVNSGGRGRWAGIVAGLGLLFFILFASGLIEQIPLAALVGVMFMVVIGTFAWSSFRIIGKIPKTDAFVLILVSVVTVFTDLAIAVMLGIVVSALAFAWEKSKHIGYSEFIDEKGGKHYILNGSIFFGSIQNFKEIFTVKTDPNEIYIDFKNSRILDHSAIEALNALTEKYAALGKKMHLLNVQSDCRGLLDKANGITEVNILQK